MSKNIVDTVEGLKVWKYIVIGAGFATVGAILYATKEILDARKAAKIKAAALADLDKATALVSESDAESFSGCGGCSSASGKDDRLKTELVSGFSDKPRFAQVNRPTPPSFRQKLTRVVANPPAPNVPTTNPPTPCDGGVLHWDSWGGQTKVCRALRS